VSVFRHYQVGYVIERVIYIVGIDVEKAAIVTGDEVDGIYNFTDLKPGEESVFVNDGGETKAERLEGFHAISITPSERMRFVGIIGCSDR